MMIETMNLKELTVLLRSHGLRVSEMTLAAGIEQKIYPFGECVRTDSGGRRFTVYTKLVQEWINERAG